MSPSKEWSVSTTTFSNGEWRNVRSKRGFADRLRILDPFQQYHGQRLTDSARHLGMTLDSRPC